ncbi:uncharacterized protein TRIVIDRAFT_157620, partial [Trichoderma virens Gv29-8]
MFWRPVTSWEASILGFTIISEESRGDYSKARCSFKLASLKASDIASQPLSNNTGSYTSLQQAIEWFQTCRMNHAHCRNTSLTDVPFKPTRLLFVQSDGENIQLRLHCSTKQLAAVPYMTLSHCWGGGSPLRLVKATLTAFQQKIDTKQLPTTFLQAAQMTKRLGCSYLWIDSLCIVQDDWDDWLREAARMGQVYKNSIGNIAATDGTDSSKGCFCIRDPRAIQPEPFDDIPDQSQYLVGGSDVFRHHILYTRGWVLQEVLLAPRVLHCCREQLYWHCDELRASEIFPNGMPASILEDYHPVTKYRSFSNELSLRWKLITYHPFTYWARLVQAYCGMSFTKTEDRAAAFSGIISLLRPHLGDYLAGLWKIFLPFELLWVAVKPSNRHKALKVPSWSWMSIDGPV